MFALCGTIIAPSEIDMRSSDLRPVVDALAVLFDPGAGRIHKSRNVRTGPTTFSDLRPDQCVTGSPMNAGRVAARQFMDRARVSTSALWGSTPIFAAESSQVNRRRRAPPQSAATSVSH